MRVTFFFYKFKIHFEFREFCEFYTCISLIFEFISLNYFHVIDSGGGLCSV